MHKEFPHKDPWFFFLHRGPEILLPLGLLLLLAERFFWVTRTPWLPDQGLAGYWAEKIAFEGRHPPAGLPIGPVTSGFRESPLFFEILGRLWQLGIPPWREPWVLWFCQLGEAFLLAWVLSRRLGWFWGATAAAFWLGDPFFVPLSTMVTSMPWVTLLGAAAYCLILALPDRNGFQRTIAAGCLAFLWTTALLLHLSAAFWIGGLLAFLWTLPRRERYPALLAAGLVGAFSFFTFFGGVAPGLSWLRTLASPKLFHLYGISSPLYVRLPHWLLLRFLTDADLFQHNALTYGTMGEFFLGAVFSLGIVLGVFSFVLNHRGSWRDLPLPWWPVTCAWGAGGFLLPTLLSSSPWFYYLVGSMPALYVLASLGLRKLGGLGSWMAVLAILGAFFSLKDMGNFVIRTGELPSPGVLAGSADFGSLPILETDLSILQMLEGRGFHYPEALRRIHGPLWVGALADGGFLVRHFLQETSAPHDPIHYLATLGPKGEVQLSPVEAGPGNPPLPGPPTLNKHPVLVPVRPLFQPIVLPKDGKKRTLTAYPFPAPICLCQGHPLSWNILPAQRSILDLDGSQSCTLLPDPTPHWIDIVVSP